MKTFNIGHGTPLANHFTSMGKAVPAFQKVDTHEQAMSMYEEYLRRMLAKGDAAVVGAMEEIAEAYIEDESVAFDYQDSESGHGDIIIKIIKEVIG